MGSVCTPLLCQPPEHLPDQGMDLVIMRPFKAAFARQTEAFLNCPGAPRTPAGNPMKPALEEVCHWVPEAWKGANEMAQMALERSYYVRPAHPQLCQNGYLPPPPPPGPCCPRPAGSGGAACGGTGGCRL
mmetsp:Transcript_2903/g.4755  ORF Transcript_2903/g.4755 Transcript_2903/m.4755 type:complete len:130 (-) Transcript_2903:200-589(-)